MTAKDRIKKGELVFYHSPNTRSTGTLILLDELGADYDMRVLNMKAGEQRQPGYLGVNPLGKVPAIVHDGALVTEQGAVYLYLADLFPEAGITPAIGDALRGPYVRWLVYYGSSFEPAVVDRALKREPGPPSTVPYGDFDSMWSTVVAQVKKGPYLFGDRFTAADVLWGTALSWITRFKLVPEVPEVLAYVERMTARPSFQRATALDAELAAKHEAAAKAAS
jgi:glutathione S-transferase